MAHRPTGTPAKPFIYFGAGYSGNIGSQQAATQENRGKNKNVFHQVFVFS